MPGGAELSSAELIAAAPDWAVIRPCPPGHIAPCDAYVVQNCVSYGAEAILPMAGKPVIKCVRDHWPVGDQTLRAFLLDEAALVLFNSPPAREMFAYTVTAPVAFCPPPLNLKPFFEAARVAEGLERSGVCWVGAMHRHKGLDAAVFWAEQNERAVDFYGDGPDRPRASRLARYIGPIPYGKLPGILACYSHLLFLPDLFETFGRIVAEAAAAGCRLIVNQNIGALWWYRYQPEMIGDGARRFWQLAGEALDA